jgi:ketosteroid isomerase-like protein
MAHPIEAIIREAYAAFARGDLDAYFRACSEDWNFNIAGQGAIAGTYRGKQGLYELAQKAMSTTRTKPLVRRTLRVGLTTRGPTVL